MARGQKIDHQELHATILTVATQIIKDEGMKSLSIRKIAKEIGCAVGTIYNIFSSIDDIFLTINAATMTRLYKQLQQEAQEESDPLTALVMLGRAYVAFSRDNYHLWSLLVDHKLQPGSTLPVNVQEKIDDLFLLVSGMVAPLVSNDKGKADLAAKVLWASLHGVCSLAMSGKLDTVKAEAADVLAESLVRNYLLGLQVK
ncbi:MAG TPA: TetR/AcrR family transcriptional regulator [Desulfocapsa sulfexigens]|nr:TetR/AcrR family transcriptional regulator [Desulfocapsa sulfexigens]